MDSISIRGGKKLNGTVSTSGAKNSSLILMFACLLAEGTHVLHNVPKLKDVESASALLESLGCKVQRDGSTLQIVTQRPSDFTADYDLVRKMRASILCLGPLLGRYGEAVVSLPGGCAIGSRPVNLHIDAMTELGAEIKLEGGYIHAKSKRLKGASILFEVATVGGTENAMMAAALAEGITTLENAAKEPEIVDLADFLNRMGAKVSGAGTSIITIEGVEKLNAAEHTVIPDRIEAGTLLIAGAIAGGEVDVTNCKPQHLEALISKLKECGFGISVGPANIKITSDGVCRAADITTAPHPGFPTDLQAQFMALMCIAEGTSVITESVFENRFMHVQELLRMGADITPKTRVAVVRGLPSGLTGAPVMATDLRASASLVLAGLAAKGETVVSRIYHLDRGYERLEEKLKSLGAQIQRIS